MMSAQQKSWAQALQWYVENGVDESLLDAPPNRLASRAVPAPPPVVMVEEPRPQEVAPALIQAKSAVVDQALVLAAGAQTLADLQAAIQEFEGIALKKTASHMVFADGYSRASIMVIGEVPGTEEDRSGKPFMGAEGQMLDRILQSIGLSRTETDPLRAVYLSNILNWRPPGNRKPVASEIELSLPFIERHIQLVQPKILVLCGGLAAQALLGTGESISKLRKVWHEYRPKTAALTAKAEPIPAIVTYHPAYLLKTPSQKRAVWADMLALQHQRKALGIFPETSA
jgi:uracil-DNA glycosylase family 4